MKAKAIGAAYESIRKFNEIASNLDDNVDKVSLALQLDLIQEEYIETVDDFDANDPVGVLDGSIDMFVTVCGFMQKLESLGYDVEEALKRVTENNLSKYVHNNEANLKNYPEKTHEIEVNKKYNLIVYKNENLKVIKPIGFKSVEIDDLVPDYNEVVPHFVEVK